MSNLPFLILKFHKLTQCGLPFLTTAEDLDWTIWIATCKWVSIQAANSIDDTLAAWLNICGAFEVAVPLFDYTVLKTRKKTK